VHKLKINGLIDHPRWYDVKCNCNHNSVETEFPIADCLHCKFEQQENSLPDEDFIIKEPDFDEEGNHLGTTHDRTIDEITICRGDKYEEIIGWKY
jgi:hypothetical protein